MLVEAAPPGRLATWLGRLATTWGQTDFSKSVELPHGPINTPPYGGNEKRHHILEIPFAKLAFLV
jgi:hypothetical protein